MPRILIVYSTTDGHTLKISQRLRQAIEPSGAQVQVVSVADAEVIDLGTYDKSASLAAAGLDAGKARVTPRTGWS